MVIVATDVNVKSWAAGKAMEFLYSSHETKLKCDKTKLKDETIKSFNPILNTLIHSSDEAERSP